jgi:hypothetical protein
MKQIRPLLFVVMPFGRKLDPTGTHEIDFDLTYENAIKPAAQAVNLDVIRADEEGSGSIIHIPMFERLLLSEIVLADLTVHNANVFYELGVRHAARPRSTILIYAKYPKEGQLPFDVNMLRATPYFLEDGRLSANEAARLTAELTTKFSAVLSSPETQDSPLFKFIKGYPGITLAHDVAEAFRDRAYYTEGVKKRLAGATREADRETGLRELKAIEHELGDYSELYSELLVDLILAYRDMKAWDTMIAVIERMRDSLRGTPPALRQLYAFALNRRNAVGDQRRAIAELSDLHDAHAHSSESCGLMGRIYKDLYDQAVQQGDGQLASGYLTEAIDWYRRGFETDPRDYYPGVNAATLLFIKGGDEASRDLPLLLGAITFALARRGGLKSRNYWDVATVLEVAALGADWENANQATGRILILSAPAWQYETTARNLRLIRDTRVDCGLETAELDALLQQLEKRGA